MSKRKLFVLSKRQKRRILEKIKNNSILKSENLQPTFNHQSELEEKEVSTLSFCPNTTESVTNFDSSEDVEVNHFEEGVVHSSNRECFYVKNILNGNENGEFQSKLQKWSVLHQVTQNATSDLLKILKSHKCFSYLPSDVRTLLKTPKTTEVRDVPPGKYFHFGIEKSVQKVIHKCNLIFDSVVVQFNIDGLPITKSNNNAFWPILGCLSKSSEVFVVGIYEGKGKPNDINDYLHDFVNEAYHLCTNGIEIGDKIVPFKIEAFVCDAPARAYITQIKHFSGFYGCGKCIIKGKTVQDRVVFIKSDCELRTDSSFRNRLQPNHHVGHSNLEMLPIDMVKCIPYEYMHLICLGVTKKLLKIWTTGKGPLAPRYAIKISKKLVKLGQCFPVEFNRKQRSLKEVDRWKATEFRTCLLYSGIIAFKKHLPENHYELFMCLSIAIRCLSTKNPSSQDISYAESLLQYFVHLFKTVYGRVKISYNVHGLIHLAEDVRNFGCLDNFSAFKFENKLGQIKRLIKKSSFSLIQVHHRLVEQDQIQLENIIEQPIYPVLSRVQSDGSYIRAQFKNYILKTNLNNGVVLLRDKKIALINKFSADRKTFMCAIFLNPVKYFSYPCDSDFLSIFKVDLNSISEKSCLSYSDIQCKCVALKESKSNIVVFPLLHCS
jgi:hypothetical protein